MNLTDLPKVIAEGYLSKFQRYYLTISYLDYQVHVRYVPFYHGDDTVFSYWTSYENQEVLIEKTDEFIKKWVDKGGRVVVE